MGRMVSDAPHRIYVHLAWTTLARVPALDGARRATIESHLLGVCRPLGAIPLEVVVRPDRVHLLVRIPAGLSVRDLGARTRGAAEQLLLDAGRVVRWSPEFAAVSVSPRDVRRLRRRMATAGLAETDLPAG